MAKTRRQFLQQLAATTGASFIAPAIAAGRFRVNVNTRNPVLNDVIIGHGDFRYRVEKDWGTLDSSQYPVKNCHEMVMDRKGRLIMITDDVRNNIIIYDKSGRYLSSWGNEYPGGHGLTIWDEGGEEFLFIADNRLG